MHSAIACAGHISMILLMTAVTARQVQVPMVDAQPAWLLDYSISHDRRAIVYSVGYAERSEIRLLRLPKRAVKVITPVQRSEANPSLSPDDKYLVFATARRLHDPFQLAIRALHGRAERILTKSTGQYDCLPSFSPDGLRIVFARASRHRERSLGGLRGTIGTCLPWAGMGRGPGRSRTLQQYPCTPRASLVTERGLYSRVSTGSRTRQ